MIHQSFEDWFYCTPILLENSGFNYEVLLPDVETVIQAAKRAG